MNTMKTALNELDTIDGKALKKAAESSQELMVLSYYAGIRTRNRNVTDIEQMRKAIEQNGESIEPSKWLEAFKTLETLGMGSLIIGRHGKSNRFKWRYSLKSIGAAAMSGKDVKALPIRERRKGAKIVHMYKPIETAETNVIDIKRPSTLKRKAPATHMVRMKTQQALLKAKLPKAPPAKRAPSSKAQQNVIYVSLSPSYTFEASIPDLTSAEADQICKAIKRCVRR